MGSPFGNIEVRGARENNLKNISLDIPRRQITVFTGVSGSGKSSLVFDTIAAESQRLLNETFSTFAQNFLPRYGQPNVDVLLALLDAMVDNGRTLIVIEHRLDVVARAAETEQVADEEAPRCPIGMNLSVR